MKDNIQADKAYAFIREQLLSGNFEPGRRLAEQTLCKSAGVNRGDIRQAFSRLQAEGLVIRGKKGGVFVREYTARDMEETYEVRQILETAAARLAIDRAEEADLQALEKTARHMLLMAENGYSLGVCEGDLRFHNLLVKAAHNDKLHELYVHANIPLSGINYIWQEKERGQEGFITTSRDHIRIAEFLRQKKIEPILELLSEGRPND